LYGKWKDGRERESLASATSTGAVRWLVAASYACMTFIYGSSWKGEMASEAKRSLDKSSEGSEEVFPGEAGK
ncbi:hypothetical protein Tco_0718355, partial [Tanacetum coccineum]